MANINSQIQSINNKADSESVAVDKLAAKQLSTPISRSTPKGMPAHIAAEHGIKPPARAGNAATTGQNNAYNLPN